MRSGVEQCDDGNDVPDDGCTNCVSDPPRCGNNRVEAGETCDDGNTVSGDACPASCRIESCTPTATRVGTTIALGYPNTIKLCTGTAGAGTCAAQPLGTDCECTANNQCASGVCATVSVGAAVVFLDYPDGRVGIPGSGNESSVVGRITGAPTGFSSAVADLDYALRETVVAFNRTLAEGQLFKASFDLCSGATAPAKNDFTCTVLQASTSQGKPLSVAEFTCALSIP